MPNYTDKKKICLEISKELYKDFNKAIIDKYGNVYGHISKCLEEGIELWLKLQRGEIA